MSWINEWRPKKFKNFLGQKYTIKILKKSIKKKDLNTSYLFTGPSGTGKTTLARIFSKALNCFKGISSKFCNKCNSCKKIDSGNSLDVIEIDASKNRGVLKIELLLENIFFLPIQSRYKIYIIDEIHTLSSSAFSLILKLLEEPPDYVKFILITTNFNKIPITVTSRCLHFNLTLVSNKSIVIYISRILIKKKFFYKQNSLWLIARLSGGNVRNSLNLIQKISFYKKNTINCSIIFKVFCIINEFFIIKFFFYIYKKMSYHLIKTSEYIKNKGLSFTNILYEIINLLYNLILLHHYSRVDLDNYKYKKRIFFFAKNINLKKIHLLYEIALLGYKNLNVIFNQHISFNVTVLRMSLFEPDF